MAEQQGLNVVADLMCLAARTAPKARGIDVILIRTLDEAERAQIADAMGSFAHQTDQPYFLRDAQNLRASGACVLLAAKNQRAALLHCGFCGFENCAANAAAGGVCSFNQIDLGIAASSAASVAALHHADCRLMYTVGLLARRLGFFDESTVGALGIPLSATGKSPFFDRAMPTLNKE